MVESGRVSFGDALKALQECLQGIDGLEDRTLPHVAEGGADRRDEEVEVVLTFGETSPQALRLLTDHIQFDVPKLFPTDGLPQSLVSRHRFGGSGSQ